MLQTIYKWLLLSKTEQGLFIFNNKIIVPALERQGFHMNDEKELLANLVQELRRGTLILFEYSILLEKE